MTISLGIGTQRVQGVEESIQNLITELFFYLFGKGFEGTEF